MIPENPAAIEAARVYTQITRLYQQVRALPKGQRLEEAGRHQTSPAYLALETQIRTLADRYAVLLAVRS